MPPSEASESEDGVHDCNRRAPLSTKHRLPSRRRRPPPITCLSRLLPGVDLGLLAECGEWAYMTRGEVLTQQGEVSSSVFIIGPGGGSVLLELDVVSEACCGIAMG